MAQPQKRTNKFNAKRTELDGVIFDSGREASVWAMLKLRERANEIVGLQRQVRFDLIVNTIKVGHYTCDFAFYDRIERRHRVIDVKSEATARTKDFTIRRKLMRACHKIDVEIWT